jgi:hypothetical protein
MPNLLHSPKKYFPHSIFFHIPNALHSKPSSFQILHIPILPLLHSTKNKLATFQILHITIPPLLHSTKTKLATFQILHIPNLFHSTFSTNQINQFCQIFTFQILRNPITLQASLIKILHILHIPDIAHSKSYTFQI